MVKNEGTIDRVIRVVAGVVLLALVGFGALSGTWMWVAGIGGVALLVTGALGYCGIYSLLGIRTCPATKQPS